MKLREVFNMETLRYEKDLFLSPGTMVWVPRDKTNVKRKKLSKGHSEGPYIILYTEEKYAYGLFCTSQSHEEIPDPYLYIKLNSRYNGSVVNTYVYMKELERIPIKDIIRVIDELTNEDFNYIQKVLWITRVSFNALQEYTHTSGDLLKQNGQLYYLYDVEEEYATLYALKESNPLRNTIRLKRKEYELDLSERIIVSDLESYQLIGVASPNERKYWNNKIGSHQVLYEKERKITTGKMVYRNNQFYYIYEEDQYFLYLFPIFLEEEEERETITIDKEFYFATFKLEKISRQEELMIIAQATSLEEALIHEQYVKRRQNDRYLKRSEKVKKYRRRKNH